MRLILMQNSENGIITTEQIAENVAKIALENDLWILPEVFDTGFNVDINFNFNKENLKQFLKTIAQKHKIAICGSIYEKIYTKIFNNFYCFYPDGQVFSQAKRHLFGKFEKNYITPANSRNIFEYCNVTFCPIICYDLRFPVWCKNNGGKYQVLLCVSQWPQIRAEERKILLAARALENLCYVVNVNGLGESTVYFPWGKNALQLSNEKIAIYNFDIQELTQFRKKRNYFNDFDKFGLQC